ncbi:uncharacterized protein LOC135494665 [Lineus longissimus]|uniref:uncharacterized protein LOC135494665 n=1 Tax=Lineus longissimus TaxID=88925 RepID=UPI00315CC7AA
MKDQESASEAHRPVQKRVLFLGVMLASFVVCFVVFGCITYVDNSDLRRELREIKDGVIMTPTEKPDSSLEDFDESDREDDEVVEEESGIPEWVPSFPQIGIKPSLPANNISEVFVSDEGAVRVRRNVRACAGCCRDCDCTIKKKKKGAKRDCKRCCQKCGSHKFCRPEKNHGVTEKAISSIFKSRIGHFIGSTEGVIKCGKMIEKGKPYALTTDTGDICAWKYATWMKRESKKLYNLQSNGKVEVRDAGLYYIYGQLIIHDRNPTASLGIMIRDRYKTGGDSLERELSRCIESAGYLIGSAGQITDESFRTCNMGSVTELSKGSEVYIVVHVPRSSSNKHIPVKTFHKVTTAFFGIIKYT